MDDSLADLYRRFDGPVPEDLERTVRCGSAGTGGRSLAAQAWDRFARMTLAAVARRRLSLPAAGSGDGAPPAIDTDPLLERLTLRLGFIRRSAVGEEREGQAVFPTGSAPAGDAAGDSQ